MNLVNDIVEQLRISVIFDEWYEGNDHLLFTNGILNINTKELLPFDKGMHFTQQLPLRLQTRVGMRTNHQMAQANPRWKLGQSASAQSMVAGGAPKPFRYTEICRDSRSR